MPVEPVAFGGLVLTGAGGGPGWVTINAGTISAVTARKPAGVLGVQTGGVIVPGLIDLHGHPEYNVFAAWEPPETYPNRQAWRHSRRYEALIKKPWDGLTRGGKSHSVKGAMARYAEVRALVGGVTAIQGASRSYPKAYEALVRNVDLWIFGRHVARSTVDITQLHSDDLRHIKAGIAAGKAKAHYVHLAEGQRGDGPSLAEWRQFRDDLGLLTSATVVIHGTALAASDFTDLADAGAKLVWSPQSNLRLYGQTTDIAAALHVGLPVSLGADWLPSGSRSLLDEMRVARRVAAAQGVTLTARQIVAMVTEQAARTAGLEDQLGVLAPGRPADLVVLQRRHDDGYESVLASDPTAVDLVVIGGDVVYGTQRLVDGLVPLDGYEDIWAWGRSMKLDASYVAARPSATGDVTFPTLTQLRATLTRRYPPVGPIFA